MRTGLLVLVVLALAACGDDPQRQDITGPVKPAAALVAPLALDAARASSICRASLRTEQAARLELSRAPADLVNQKKARTFGALVTTACK